MLAMLLPLACGAVLAEATLARNADYRTEVSFWEQAVRRSPHKARVLNNLGYAYALVCRDAEAAELFRRAAALDADSRAGANLRLLERGELFEHGERGCEKRP